MNRRQMINRLKTGKKSRLWFCCCLQVWACHAATRQEPLEPSQLETWTCMSAFTRHPPRFRRGRAARVYHLGGSQPCRARHDARRGRQTGRVPGTL